MAWHAGEISGRPVVGRPQGECLILFLGPHWTPPMEYALDHENDETFSLKQDPPPPKGVRRGVLKGVEDGRRPPGWLLLKRPNNRFRSGLPAGHRRVRHDPLPYAHASSPVIKSFVLQI
jgi:hypothetical protein